LGVLAHGGEWSEGRVAYLAHFIHIDSEGVQHPVSPASQEEQKGLLQDLESDVRKQLPGTDPAFLGLSRGRFVMTFSASSRRLSAPPVVYHHSGLLRRLDPVLRSILEQVRKTLNEHSVNELRRDLGEMPVSGVWCWSGGHRLPAPPVRSTGCALLSPDPFIKGLAVHGQVPFLSLPDPYHASGPSFPTREVKELLRTHDELLIWIPAPFASEDFQEAQEKVRRMVEMDYRLLGPIRSLLQEEERARLLLAAAGVRHRGRPERGLAPCLLWGTGVSPDPVSEWTEAAGMEGRLGMIRWSSLLETLRK
jgi:2,3-bisphosphoglycerate-independent phosphoglycerate mutase